MAGEIIDKMPVIEDRPMTCCGMLMAHGFNEKYQNGTRSVPVGWREPNGEKIELPNFKTANLDIQKKRFQKVIAAQTKDIWAPRNCAVVTLSSTQRTEIEAAKASGFKCVFEFYNPNSGNMVGIYTHTLWDNDSEFMKSDVYKQRNIEDDDE